MTLATIKSVGEPREWTFPDGARGLEFIDITFVDGSKGTYTSKPGHSAAHVERFIRLIGQPGEFQLEPKPDHNGQKQWKIADYPGKPTPQGFLPVRTGRTESWGYSEAGSRFREDQSNRRTALMTTRDLIARGDGHITKEDLDYIVQIATALYEWLSKPPADASPLLVDAAGTAGREEAQSAAEPSRPATTTTQDPWVRYQGAQAALQAHLKLHSLTQVRLAYVKPFCASQGWDFPPTSGWPAEDIEAIAVMLERRLAVETHSTAESA